MLHNIVVVVHHIVAKHNFHARHHGILDFFRRQTLPGKISEQNEEESLAEKLNQKS